MTDFDIVDLLRDMLPNSGFAPTENWLPYRAANEIERLRKMVKDAYNDGFTEGMKEVTSSRGGIPWSDSKWRLMLERTIDD